MLSLTALKAIEAYGGKELWTNSKHIEAEVSVTGLAFTLKRRPIFENVKITMDIKKPFSKISAIGKDKNVFGILDGNDVRLEDSTGKILAERKNARSFFPFGRRLFYWDDLDMAYFANYAFWNYFTLPHLLLSDKIEWVEKEAGVLVATFPDDFPTHCKVQEFIFDTTSGLLIQHNYTVDIISKLAEAANVITEHKNANAYTFPAERIVTPRSKSGKALAKPILIDIKVHSYKLIS